MITQQDLQVLCCPACRGDLSLDANSLSCLRCHKPYPIVDGIPRFVGQNPEYNKTWDYKWSVLDGGKGYNYQIIERGSAAYNLHNLFRFFEDLAGLFDNLGKGLAADIGCGTGQYSISLLEKGAQRVYAIDLTRGVDIGQKLILSRYPQFKDRVVFLQADARHLPLRTGSMDLSMALGSIHHSGFLEQCVGEVIRITGLQKRFFIWIYSKPLVPISDTTRTLTGWLKLNFHLAYFSYAELIFNLIKRLPEAVRIPLLKIFASNLYYAFRQIPLFGRIFMYAFPGVGEHPDPGYRLINLYDAYSPAYSEASDEGDFIRWSQKFKFRILNFSVWRLGIVGLKETDS